MRPRIHLLATGGTIASLQSPNGLAPAMPAAEILRLSPRLHEDMDITSRDVFTLDSSNIQPEEWQVLARAVQWHSEHRVLQNGHKTVVFR